MKSAALIVILLISSSSVLASIQDAGRVTQKCTTFHECAETGDTKRLGDLLRTTTEVDVRDEFGATPLFTAVRYDQRDAASLLIAFHANVNAEDHEGTTPLMMAVLGTDLSLVRELIAAGADINARDDEGYTVLMHGSAFDSKEAREVLRVLVSHGANVNAAADDGTTALMFSIAGNSMKTLTYLVSLGANVNVKDNKGLTPLDHTKEIWRRSPNNAARKLERRMRHILISAGAVQSARG